ncbi:MULTISPECIES: C40 family peptidase [Bacillaceae]|uniref:C40 family peptidase n=1 Tax=Bacillaceae TaxID=186817 RepID=UPI000C774A19|nr:MULTISPECIES: C40 family peptidase [Bacillaceae]PLR69256.1 peptidase [Bacillus sp. UMB0893]QNG59277.1 C40 family peptidase [Bacillus sp. PAMC26568]
MTIQKGRVAVSVATVWTAADSARKLDEKAVVNPVEIESWLDGLTYETKLELCNENRVQTQALFGEEVWIVSEIEGWAEIIVPSQSSSKDERGYPGWMPLCQIERVEESWQGPIAVIQSKKAMLYSAEETPLFELSFQTQFSVIKKDTEWIEVKTPLGKGKVKPADARVFDTIENVPKGSGKDIVADGETFIGLPYLWGGMSSFGFDCSGFSYTMCKANGYEIPRDAHDQAASGKKVELDAIQPGDLLFFAYKEGKGRLHHVGIYHGDGKLLHSPNTGKSIEILEMAGTVYEKELCAARRYWHETEG